MAASTGSPISITIVTGFLGSGKTTLLLNLLPQLKKINPDYKLALVKNEFGDLAVDSQLASSSSISGVQELLNGCICCNLVGSLSPALNDLSNNLPGLNRIIIETSGSAFPATLAMEINRLSLESKGRYVLDGVVSVIDVENWKGYEDTSYTAKLQARYTDLIVFNKWEEAGEARWDECLDRVGDLDTGVAWVKSDEGKVPVDVVFGIDGGLARSLGADGEHDHGHGHDHDHVHKEREKDHGHQAEVEVLSLTLTSSAPEASLSIKTSALHALLTTAPKDEIYRIKAVFASSSPVPSSDTSSHHDDLAPSDSSRKYILNWAFGRWTTTPLAHDATEHASSQGEGVVCRMTIILARFESKKWTKRLEAGGLVESSDGNGNLKVERIM